MGHETVFDYCEEDVRKTLELLRVVLRGPDHFGLVDIPRVLHWSNYSAKAIASIQARRMPIDLEYWNVVQENKALVVAELIRRFDPIREPQVSSAQRWPVKAGEWPASAERCAETVSWSFHQRADGRSRDERETR
jgi:hypothetical protein